MKKQNRAILIALDNKDIPDLSLLLDELELLLSNLSIKVIYRSIQKKDAPDPAFMLGKGKATEVAVLCEELNADLVVSDERLNPTQMANLKQLTGRDIWDRAFVIMKIFQARAHTAEAKLQVELARCAYEIPLLKGLGKQMSRPGGGIGTRGPGETEFERHRRKLERRTRDIKKRLKKVEKRRTYQRKRRQKAGMPVISLVGYTNSGKSTLLKRLSSDNSLDAAERLFCTLDTFMRRVRFPGGSDILISDTVGFIRRLPPDLVAAFNTTLEEIRWSKLLVLVLDASSASAMEHFEVVQQTLYDVGASSLPRLVVLNKIDKTDPDILVSYVDRLSQMGEDVVSISSITGEGLINFKNCVEELVSSLL